VYQLGPRSWKPDASLSQSVSETDIAQTCKLSHDTLMSTNHADQQLKPTDEAVRMSSQFNNSNNGPATEPAAATDGLSSIHRSKLTWSASGGLKQTVASDDDFE